jgi:hypothetical protein
MQLQSQSQRRPHPDTQTVGFMLLVAQNTSAPMTAQAYLQDSISSVAYMHTPSGFLHLVGRLIQKGHLGLQHCPGPPQ